MDSTPYRSAYTGQIVRQNGIFDYFERQTDDSHRRSGAWLFNSASDDRLAFLRGFYNPETVLYEVAQGRGKHDDINILWTPGQNDLFMPRAISGSPAQHLHSIFNARRHLGLPLSLREQVPLYPIDPRMRAYWEVNWTGVMPNELASPADQNCGSNTLSNLAVPVQQPEVSQSNDGTVRTSQHEATVIGQERTKDDDCPMIPSKETQSDIARAGRRGYSSAKPRCKNCIKKRKGCDRNRPCQHCYTLAECVSEEEREPKPASKKIRRERKDAVDGSSLPRTVYAPSSTPPGLARASISEGQAASRPLKQSIAFEPAPEGLFTPKPRSSNPAASRSTHGTEKPIGTTFIAHSFVGGIAVRPSPNKQDTPSCSTGTIVVSHMTGAESTDLSQIETIMPETESKFGLEPKEHSYLSPKQAKPSSTPLTEGHDSTHEPRTSVESGPCMRVPSTISDSQIPQNRSMTSNLGAFETDVQDIPQATTAHVEEGVPVDHGSEDQNSEVDTTMKLQQCSVYPRGLEDLMMGENDRVQPLDYYDNGAGTPSSASISLLSADDAFEPPPIVTTEEAATLANFQSEKNESAENGSDLYYLSLPCLDCGKVGEHKWDCNIGKLKPMKNLTVLDYRNLSDASDMLNVYEPMDITGPEVPPGYFDEPEDPETRIRGMAEIIRNEESYRNDEDLHSLPDDMMILLWALKSSPNVEVYRG